MAAEYTWKVEDGRDVSPNPYCLSEFIHIF
jgi:hypothetical protein